eukprot:3556890-Rhodomonas_salina.3
MPHKKPAALYGSPCVLVLVGEFRLCRSSVLNRREPNTPHKSLPRHPPAIGSAVSLAHGLRRL